jgi:hypothetical protein
MEIRVVAKQLYTIVVTLGDQVSKTQQHIHQRDRLDHHKEDIQMLPQLSHQFLANLITNIDFNLQFKCLVESEGRGAFTWLVIK